MLVVVVVVVVVEGAFWGGRQSDSFRIISFQKEVRKHPSRGLPLWSSPASHSLFALSTVSFTAFTTDYLIYLLTWLLFLPTTRKNPWSKNSASFVNGAAPGSSSHSGNNKPTNTWNSGVGLRPAPGTCHHVLWRGGDCDARPTRTSWNRASVVLRGRWKYHKLKNWGKMLRKTTIKMWFFCLFVLCALSVVYHFTQLPSLVA